ncbi:uncharacterized protein LOC132718797 isoform X2 [Ruditapes philippinarum]|uniref:uncharacterized protein LOC132718797 isoform X2 n=1 Tax=Ruditapes philippinarum TaxID=129788 RepID=UPI00295B15D5|nr:uncharacterized protein LOC132718797 isoform X2 [Ruditapes philippinarum]
MGTRFKIITLCMLCLVLIVLAIVLALFWSMPDLNSSVSNNEICFPAEKGYLVCNDTRRRRLSLYLNKIISVSYDKVKRVDKEQHQQFLTEKRGHFMAIYYTYFWDMKPSTAKVTGKEHPVNTKATDKSCKQSYNYEMLCFVGLSVSVIYIGIMLAKIRHEVRTIGNGKFGLCDGCHQPRDIVRLVLCSKLNEALREDIIIKSLYDRKRVK